MLNIALCTCRYYIDMGLENVIRSFFSDPDWCQQRGKHRNLNGEGSYWDGSEAQRLREHK